MVGGVKRGLDLSRIPAAERQAAVSAAAQRVEELLPEGSALHVGSLGSDGLRSASFIAMLLPSSEAIESVELMRGVMTVPRPADAAAAASGRGGAAWDIPIRMVSRMPPGHVQVTFVGMQALPDAVQRPGLGSLLLGGLGVRDARVAAEFHPVGQPASGGVSVRLAHKLVVWVRMPADEADTLRLPSVMEFEGHGRVRVFIDHATGRRAPGGGTAGAPGR